MIFFNVPSVGQAKPETLFGGEDDHFGFMQTILGDVYKANDINKKCREYYNKPAEDYWGRIITLINFLGLKKLDSKGKILSIPAVDYIAEQYDENNKLPSKMMFDYLLCQWQYPHPIVTKPIDFNDKEFLLHIQNPRINFPICKPYSMILSILSELSDEDPKESYLSNAEFYWLGYEYYRTEGMDFNIKSLGYWIKGIKDIRQNGWQLYSSKAAKRTHLSYPKGFLKNSSILTDDNKLYNNVDDFFIGLKKVSNLKNKLESLINASNTIFEFDRNLKVNDKKLSFEFANYLYSPKKINDWISTVEIYDSEDLQIPNYNISNQGESIETEAEKVKNLLKRISILDKEAISKRRAEQHFLRYYLLGNKKAGKCAICNQEFPINFLATAHIKKRSDCSEDEKRDINIVMPACYLGCDKLYEDGYLIVKNGKVKSNTTKKITTTSIENYLENLEEKDCVYYKENTKQYFEFHEQTNL